MDVELVQGGFQYNLSWQVIGRGRGGREVRREGEFVDACVIDANLKSVRWGVGGREEGGGRREEGGGRREEGGNVPPNSTSPFTVDVELYRSYSSSTGLREDCSSFGFLFHRLYLEQLRGPGGETGEGDQEGRAGGETRRGDRKGRPGERSGPKNDIL
jgi:hypothetical protein